MKERAKSIDALRGYAIITMVLSATIVMGILPGWMYHAQVPPPDHAFNPNLPGLTWVDLVFPSFLFAMGAAFPFSIGKKIQKGVGKLRLSFNAIWRGIQLTYFAILIQHFYPYMTGGTPKSCLLALFCFVLLFPIFMRLPFKIADWIRIAIQLASMAIGIIVILCIDYPNGYIPNLYTSNIIILILANMAVFASLLYIYTINMPKLRIAILMVLFGVMLSASANDSWAEWFMHYSPLTWFYNPTYLKYLYIVIPGCFAGEILVKWLNERKSNQATSLTTRNKAWATLLITLAIVIANLYCLYMRYTEINFVVNSILLLSGWFLLRRSNDYASLWYKLFITGAFLLLLGLALEPFEGGIKKDPVTYSYLFTTSGLSFMTMIFFSVVCDYFKCERGTSFLVLSGQNPMIAYVAGDLLIMPLLQLTGIWQFFSIFSQSAFLGFVQGVILTSLAVVVTMFFTKINFLWRT